MKRADLARAKRVVVKVGTSLLAPPSGGVHARRFSELAAAVAEQVESGRQIVLVSSGAVGLGARRLGLHHAPDVIPEKQALAAVGQIDLCRRYERAFARHGLHVGQILLTHAGLSDRERFLNARRTVQSLLARRIVPIVNENDSVATEELRYGDNDQLAVLVVNAVEADALILLTDRDGLLDRSPSDGRGRLIRELDAVTPAVLDLATGPSEPLGSGGMRAKLEAARAAARFGVPTVIANGRRRQTLPRVLAGQEVGTLIHPSPQALSSRKHWIAFSLRPAGTVQIDAGAVKALRERGRSLLPAGVLAVEGGFRVGDLVRCMSETGEEIARGLSAYGSAELDVIKGHQSARISDVLGYSNGDAVIHRDDLIVL